MAYGTRWFSEFDDIHDNVVYRVEVLERDYAGEATEVLSSGNPLTIEMAKVDNIFAPIRPQKATVEWISDEISGFQISDLFITDDRKYKLVVYYYEGESLLFRWAGYLVPIECEEPFASKPYPVSFSATCGLPFLSDDYLLDGFGSFILGEKTLINLIANCLTTTGHAMEIDTYIDITAEGMSDSQSALVQAAIDSDGLRGKMADEVLGGILNAFDAFITQGEYRWVIKGLKEQDKITGSKKTFDESGNFAGSQNVAQVASIGRTAHGNGYPNIRPTSEVVERIAEPNSIVTETVSPGVPVNRLPNGLFAGPIVGGNIPGWNNHIGSIPWQRQGFNTPTDPYRIEFYKQIELDPKGKKAIFRPWSYFDSGPITLNVGDFNIPDNRRKETKIVLMGAFKAHNALAASFMLSINENEREYASYLDDNGEWFYSKKEAKSYSKRTTQPKYEPGTKGYDDLELQTFEIESKRINNLLNRPEGAVVVLRLRIFPGTQGPKYNGDDAFLSLEDLALIVVEDTVYEGEHKYQVDGHLPIRNANEVEYTTIIADKIDITTPEQSRDVNRVMTGYMNLAGSGTLTTGWKYPGDAGYEPIQKRSLRNRIRQLNGKRRVLDGTFVGYNVTPDLSIFERYENPGTPNTFFTQTGWKWDVKNAQYDISVTELDFSPLPEEDLYLYDDQDGRRGNRMYRGNSSSGTGGGQSSQETDAIAFDDIPPVYFTVGEQAVRIVDLAEYLVSEHEPYLLTDRELHYTDWVSNAVIDRGEDGLDLKLQITALPKVPGTDRVLVEFEGQYGEKYIAKIDLVAVLPLRVKNSLLEIFGEETTVVGPIPGSYPVPVKSDIAVSISGTHDFYQLTLEGGGDTGKAFKQTVNQAVEPTSSATYRFFQEDNGYVLEAGNYRLYVYGASNENTVYDKDFTFVLYDDEFLAKAKFYFTSGGVDVGELDPAGTSKFPDPGAWDNKIVIADVEHDKAIVRLIDDGGGVLHERTIEHGAPVMDGEYLVYETDQAHPLGIYTVSISLYLAGEEVLMRYTDFETVKEVPEAVGGALQLLKKSSVGVSFSVVATLPKTGVSAQTLVPWNIGSDAVTDPFDWEGDELFELKAGSLVKVDVSTYIGRPPYVEYPYEVTFSDYQAFDNLSSEDIGKIHGNNKTFRYIRTRKIGGQSGDVVAVFQADFSFGTLVPIGEDAEIEEPGSGYVDFRARDGIGEEVIDYVKYFDVRVDNLTIEIKEPGNPDKNWLGLIEKGVLYKYIQDMPADTVLGRRDTVGTPGAIQIKKLLADVDPGDLVTIDVIEELVEQALEGSISGTVDFLPKFGAGGHSLVNSVVRESGGMIGIGTNPIEALHVLGNIRAAGTLISAIADGTPPISVISTTLVYNLNVDRLDDQHGPYYLDWNNFTNYKSITVGTGMTGGGVLSANVPVGLDFTYLDARWASAGSYGLAWDGVNIDSKGKFNSSSVNGPIGGVVSGVYMPQAGSLTYGASIAFRNGLGWFKTLEAGVWGSWLQFADRTWVGANYVPLTRQIIAGTGLSGTGTLATDRTLSVVYGTASGTATEGNDSRVLNGQTAFSWGNHALAGYLTGAYSSLDWSLVNSPGTFKINSSSVNNPFGGGTVVHGIWIPHQSGTTYGSELVFRASQSFFRSLENGVWGSWLQIADRAWVDAKSISAGVGLTGGGDFSANRTISMGAPSTLTNATTNSASGTTHTHAIQVSNLLAGTNVSLSASGTGVILGANNITINVSTFPWTGITSKPTTIFDYGITDAYNKIDVDLLLTGKENTFSKGDIIQGAGLSITGTLTDKLVGSSDVTFALAASGVSAGTYGLVIVDVYGRVTSGSNPSTLAGHGITNAYTKAEVDALIAGVGGLTGSGANSKVAVWGASNTLTDGIMYDTGGQVTVDGHLVIQSGLLGLPRYSSAPTGTFGGEMYFSTASNLPRVFDGTTWKTFQVT